MVSVRAPLPTSQNKRARNQHAFTTMHRRSNVINLGVRIAICFVLLASVLLAPSAPAGANDSASDSVTLHASIVSLIAVDVPDFSPDCRMLYAGGQAGGSRSAYCAMVNPLTIRVLSNAPWHGSFELHECASNKPSLTLESGALRSSPTLVTSYPVASSATILEPGPLLGETHHAAGEATYTSYLALRVNNGQRLSDFCATVSYAATQDSMSSLTIGSFEVRFQPVSQEA